MKLQAGKTIERTLVCSCSTYKLFREYGFEVYKNIFIQFFHLSGPTHNFMTINHGHRNRPVGM